MPDFTDATAITTSTPVVTSSSIAMFQASLLGIWGQAPAVSAADFLQQSLHGSGWFRMVYDTDGWPILRSRSARVDSGLIISSDPTLGGLIACPFEAITPTRTFSWQRRIVTYAQQYRPSGLPSLGTSELIAWGPLLITDLRSDDPYNLYEQPTTDPTTGLTGGDPYTISQIVYFWTADAPQSVADLDPLTVLIQQRADKHWLQQRLGDHHRVELQVDSAVALAECGQELFLHWPERGYSGHYQIIKMVQPLGLGPQIWTAQYISQAAT